MENQQSTDKPLYQELFDLHSQGRASHNDYYMKGQQFAWTFAKRIFAVMGYPTETFKTETGEDAPWVQLYELDENHAVKRKNWPDLSSWDNEGHLRFGVGITLSHSLNSHPKERLWIGYTVKPTANGARLEELASRQGYDITADTASLAPAVASFIAQVREALSRTPADSFRERPGIGFLP